MSIFKRHLHGLLILALYENRSFSSFPKSAVTPNEAKEATFRENNESRHPPRENLTQDTIQLHTLTDGRKPNQSLHAKHYVDGANLEVARRSVEQDPPRYQYPCWVAGLELKLSTLWPGR